MTTKKIIKLLHEIECHILDAESDLDKARIKTKILRMDLEDEEEQKLENSNRSRR